MWQFHSCEPDERPILPQIADSSWFCSHARTGSTEMLELLTGRQIALGILIEPARARTQYRSGCIMLRNPAPDPQFLLSERTKLQICFGASFATVPSKKQRSVYVSTVSSPVLEHGSPQVRTCGCEPARSPYRPDLTRMSLKSTDTTRRFST